MARQRNWVLQYQRRERGAVHHAASGGEWEGRSNYLNQRSPRKRSNRERFLLQETERHHHHVVGQEKGKRPGSFLLKLPRCLVHMGKDLSHPRYRPRKKFKRVRHPGRRPLLKHQPWINSQNCRRAQICRKPWIKQQTWNFWAFYWELVSKFD